MKCLVVGCNSSLNPYFFGSKYFIMGGSSASSTQDLFKYRAKCGTGNTDRRVKLGIPVNLSRW